jgi:hypothetical protein
VNKRPKRVTFRMKPEEYEALRALAVRSHAWDASKCIRLALSVLCQVILHDLPEDSPALHFRTAMAQQLLNQYRTAYLAGCAKLGMADNGIPGKSDKPRKRPPQKPSARFKGLPAR